MYTPPYFVRHLPTKSRRFIHNRVTHPFKITGLLSYDLSGALSQVLLPYNDRSGGDLNLGSIPPLGRHEYTMSIRLMLSHP